MSGIQFFIWIGSAAVASVIILAIVLWRDKKIRKSMLQEYLDSIAKPDNLYYLSEYREEQCRRERNSSGASS